MRIPLDYYRILGLPIQATADQLQQAHRDRTQQLPRREYSEAAIASRKQLLDEAYAALSNPEQRRAYDATFLASSHDPTRDRFASAESGAIALETDADPYAPSIDIDDSQLVGALLILLELGEYELVLKLGHPYLSNSAFSGNAGRSAQADIARSDVVLTLAFAYLELGREQWQQGQYESAAESLEAGQELLLREGMFASVRGEMQSDLYKLRPYRILELLALPESHEIERGQGMNLLRDMLQDRGGIDGTGDDRSGLNVEDFLRFIQQLRGYLTAAEQHALFEVEARRPSAVATYLAVYALLARGFAYRQPALIRRAKQMLMRLGTRQDVYLEQAVCALLLGQTEEATRALERSQEHDSLTFIREHSQGSPDLLPGLCLYGERWLQNEVFPHFRDLAQQRASLKDYFADEQVQAYLEELPSEPDTAQWEATPAPIGSTTGSTTAPFARRATAPQSRYTQAETAGNGLGMGGTATLEPAAAAYAATNGTSAVPTAERVSQMSPSGRLATGGGSGRSPRSSLSDSSRRTSTSLSGNSGGGSITLRLDRLMLLLALGVLSLGLLWLLLSWVARSFNSGPVLEGEQLSISLAEPVVPIPEETEQSPAPADPSAPLTAETGKTLVETWLRAKSAAMGSSYDTSQLEQILADPMLSQWRSNSEAARLEGSSLTYTHEVRQVNVLPPTASSNTDEAQIDAVVVENGETLNVRYYLTRQGGQWRIRSNEILPDGPLESMTSSDNAGSSASGPAALPITSPGLQPAPSPSPALLQSPAASPLPEGSLPAPGSAVPGGSNAAPAGNGASGRLDPADASN
ncbi:IMS domain-containing protein [Thermoleptolyngbya sp.]